MATIPKTGAAATKRPAVAKSRISLERSMPASKAKTHLLELLDSVDRDRKSVTITKRGRPVAALVPIQPQPHASIFGFMKGTGRITGDVVGPEPDIWNAMVE